MNEMISYISRQTKPMDIADFYTIETPPSSSSTSKDSTDEFLLSIQSKKKLKLSTTNIGQKSTNTIICSTSKSTLTTNPVIIKDNEVIEEEKNHIFKI
jgi:hypothetical protein